MRALSAPSRSLQASEALEHDWQQKNVALQNYVGGLLAEPTFGETPEASESEEDMASGNDEENPGLQDDDAVGVRLNEGSLGHPGLCRRPCVHFAKAPKPWGLLVMILILYYWSKLDAEVPQY